MRYAPCGKPMWYEKALFAASRAAIRAVPLRVWRRMLESVGDHANPVVAHYLERTWYHVIESARAPTFVTCFVDVYSDAEPRGLTREWRMAHFVQVADTGVRIVAYGYESTLPMLRRLERDNVRVLEMDYKSTPTYRACTRPGVALPASRHPAKDTVEYIALMNAKIEFVNHAIELNPWGSIAFAWFDFSMARLFKNDDTLDRLGRLSIYDANFLAFPGYWDRGGELLDSVSWHFCGTFFVGNGASLSRFCETCRRHLPRFLELHGRLVWEVNFWAHARVHGAGVAQHEAFKASRLRRDVEAARRRHGVAAVVQEGQRRAGRLYDAPRVLEGAANHVHVTHVVRAEEAAPQLLARVGVVMGVHHAHHHAGLLREIVVQPHT